MARVKYSPIVSDISGSVGSSTFQKSLYGNTLRNRPRSQKTSTAAQLHARTYMMQCQNAWRNLTPAVRRQWDQFISFSGQSINRDRGILTTGHALFLKWNYARLAAGFSIVSALVYKAAPVWPSFVQCISEDPLLYLIFSDDTDVLDIWPTLFLSPRRQDSQSFFKQGLRFMPGIVYVETETMACQQYKTIFGVQPGLGWYLHYQLQFFSKTAPLLSSLQTGIIIVELL